MPTLDLLATGYPSLDHIATASRCAGPGETALIASVLEESSATLGGCGANVAVGLHRLGFATGAAFVLGDDTAGHGYRETLIKQGIDVRNVALLPGERTSRSYLFRSPDGEYQNYFFPGAADVWQGKLKLTGLDSCRLALVTVNYLPYNLEFVARCTEANVPLAWQLKPDIAAYPASAIQSFARASRLIFCNLREAGYLLDTIGIQDARALCMTSAEAVITTLGEDGARVTTREGEWTVPAVRVQAVDTTGAGDAFTSGYLAGFLRGLPPLRCAEMGVVAASFAVEAVGCQTNLPDHDRLQARLKESFGI